MLVFSVGHSSAAAAAPAPSDMAADHVIARLAGCSRNVGHVRRIIGFQKNGIVRSWLRTLQLPAGSELPPSSLPHPHDLNLVVDEEAAGLRLVQGRCAGNLGHHAPHLGWH